jgi:hexosaminidase
MKGFILVLLVILGYYSLNAQPTSPHYLWPMPETYKTLGEVTLNISSPCNFSYVLVSQNTIPQLQEILALYQSYMFPFCPQRSKEDILTEMSGLELPTGNNNVLYINISDTTNIVVSLTTDESYDLGVSAEIMALTSKTYIGFLRGLETFSQLISYANNGTVPYIPTTPILITDNARYPHRGLMIDTARHFISVQNLLTILDGMLFTKLNVFHWHITDSDSFPLQSLTNPNLTWFGAFSPQQVYSQSDINSIVEYALARGIMIIPEIDSPSHVTSWSYAPEVSHLVNCSQSVWYHGIPFGQINPTLNETYEIVKGIFDDLDTYFPWDILHMGCDEVFSWCWENSEILQWMSDHDMTDFNQLFNYYISQQRTVKNPNKTSLYWGNSDTNFLEFQSDDLIQYWGNGSDLQDYMETYPKNHMVLSNYDALYLDCGLGNYFGNEAFCNPFSTWLMIYQWEPMTLVTSNFYPNILGAEVCEWSEINDDGNILNKMFPRSAALAERLWSPYANQYNNTLSVFERLNAWRYRVQARGVPSMPISAGYCEQRPTMCF